MSFFYIDDNLFLEGNSLGKYPKIYNKLMEISGSCHSVFNTCQVYGEPCKSFVGMHIPGLPAPENDLPQKVEETMADKIQTYVIVILFPGFVEIYDLCTEIQSRRKGNADKLLDAVKILASNDNEKIWIGILPENEIFEKLASFYIKKGFSNPYLSNITPGGKVLSFSFIGLWYDKVTIGSNVSEILEKTLDIRNQYLIEKNTCGVNLFLPLSVCESLYTYISKDTEYGGILTISNMEQIGGFTTETLDYPISSETKGANKPIYTVNPPLNGPINWHSHPEICYRDINYLCYIGWPSGGDMASLVLSYDAGLRKHFVITVEGIYSIQLTVKFAYFWSKIKNQDCRNAIVYGIFNQFSEIEKHRGLRQISKENLSQDDIENLFASTNSKFATFQAYLSEANGYTLEKMINNELLDYIDYIKVCLKSAQINQDFVLYRVEFKNWNDIRQDQGFLVTATYLDDATYNCV